MSYLALARKWRPKTFYELIGQHHVTQPIINSLLQQRIHHAYLFTGTRGVGKTSIARLLAKALNCTQGISPEPCLQCSSCIAIDQGCSIDLFEIDGASRTRVEDTRELLESVQYAPTTARFKIYLIDEVHMLSQHSFNALLKTLEEPPLHVKFLLATTDPQKLPATVLSRCLQFNLKHLQPQVIIQKLQEILTDEALPYEQAALELLATAAKGSMRDALSLLDQAITSCDQQLCAQDVRNMLGFTQQDYALQILQALAEVNIQQLLHISKRIGEEGGYFRYVLDELLQYLHQMNILQFLSQPLDSISVPALQTLSHKFSPEDVHLFYQICLKGIDELFLAPLPAIGFEMILLRMYTFKPAHQPVPTLAYHQLSQEETLASLEIHEEACASPLPLAGEGRGESEGGSIPHLTSSQNNLFIQEPSLPLHDEEIPWHDLLPKLNLNGLALSAAENTQWVNKTATQIFLRAARQHQSLFTSSVVSRMEQALTRYYKNNIKIVLQYEDQVASPALHKQIMQEKHHKEAEIALQEDVFFNQLKQEFSAELIKSSISSVKDDL